MKIGAMRSAAARLPIGFIASIYHTHIAKQGTDYLPDLPNVNEPKSLGVVMPRQIVEDWVR